MFDDSGSTTCIEMSTHNMEIKMLKLHIIQVSIKMESQAKHEIEIIISHSLYSRGDERHTDHHQVQDIEVVSTE